MKTTRDFEEQVLRKRPYIQRRWCEDIIAAPIRREAQADGRIRFWGAVRLEGETRLRFYGGEATIRSALPSSEP
jgi:hypothetical protein